MDEKYRKAYECEANKIRAAHTKKIAKSKATHGKASKQQDKADTEYFKSISVLRKKYSKKRGCE